MKVRFYGVRGSLPTPGPTTVRYGGNTPCVEVTVPESDELFIIDAGTGIRELGGRLASKRGKPINLFISHTHWDHIHGFPFFVPIYMPHHTVKVYGPTNDSLDLSLQDVLTKQMEYSVFPVRFGDLQASISYTAMKRGTTMMGGVEVTAHPLNHPVLTLGYSLAYNGCRVVYQSDHEPYYNLFSDEDPDANSFIDELNREIVEFARDADLLIADAMYTPEEYETHRGWGHSSTFHVLERAIEAGAKRLAVFHHDPIHSDDFLDRHLDVLHKEAETRNANVEIFIAAEGEEIDLGG
ncbi:MAG: MBL fold metallo-hydrolase [Candidatus Hydrogenedentota bacterium]|nr:MAG: MBL fold metallo-hydrolase [Candidatus Hydrogenedentota bacterium]